MATRNQSYEHTDEVDNYDENESSDEGSHQSDYHYSKPTVEVKEWDVFVANDDEATSASEQHTDLIKKASVALKLITVTFTFLVVLTCTVVAKGATFFMVAQASRNSRLTEFCLADLPEEVNVTIVNGTNYQVGYTEKESVAWLWCIFFVFLGPELLAFGRALRVCVMRHTRRPSLTNFGIVTFFETLHVFGLAILFYVAFPALDSTRALMATSGVCLMPALHKLFVGGGSKKKWQKWTIVAINVISFAIQLAGLFIWVAYDSNWDKIDSLEYVWALPVGLFLTSFGWWESFVDENSFSPVSRYLWRVKTAMIEEDERYSTYFFVSIWKMSVFFASFIGFTYYTKAVTDIANLFNYFNESFQGMGYLLQDSQTILSGVNVIVADPTYLPAKVLAVQLAATYLAYIFGKFACKVNIQRVSFALPLNLATPVAVVILISLCKIRSDDKCAYSGELPSYAFFECPPMTSLFTDIAGWVWFMWLLSQIWTTVHVWFPKSIRLASTEQMFGHPYFSGLLPEQSYMLNRRSDSGKMAWRLDVKRSTSSASSRSRRNTEPIYEDVLSGSRADDSASDSGVDGVAPRKISKFGSKRYEGEVGPEDEVIRVYGCATMWHENGEEMAEMLKSIFRMDEDYSARIYAKERLNVPDPDFFIWETHIFFDDAFEPDDSGKLTVVNSFVRDLVAMVDEQGKKWYGSRNMKVPHPTRYPTPYGGRLVWILPGATKIICHLKDKNKIRHKKRWSQCMYMYYFLGFCLEGNDSLSQAQKDVRARNTFLLALDGDVDFQPDAIVKLVDLMKRNPDVGASCGRIHPTGSGYMQWYQMFEYAIGHWLQKSTEHIMGCVLCSPGCFSLFRGKALMDQNIAKTYTTVSTEPRHFIQYDQGEDRWLCTLMLQQGWRVEYSAASDSFTACPQGFGEFYNQRRRWMPSTLANIMDLLGDYKRVMRNNDDISIFYIIYQVMMMIGTILGPGSIYIMLCGALSVAFGLSNWTAFLVNLVPLIGFIVICLWAKSDNQIIAAQILSVAYALVMMAVLIGMLIQVAEDGWLAPSTLSLLFVTFVFVLAGFLHPQELACLPMGVIYYITIPSMYLFLTIYSVFNLNVVSWGTREVPKKKTADELEQERLDAEERAKNPPPPKKASFLSKLFGGNSSLEFSMSRIFKRTDDNESMLKNDLEKMSLKLDRIEFALKKEGYTIPNLEKPDPEPVKKPSAPVKRSATVRIVEPKDQIIRDDLHNPFWIEREADVGDGPKKKLPRREVTFWLDLIEKYLKPLEKDAEKEKAMGNALKELRNQMVFSFLMINSIWCLTIFLLQENKSLLYVEWPIGPEGPNITFESSTSSESTIYVDYTYLQLEPIGLLFLIFFAFVLLIQLVGMLAHRVMTLGHIVATTSVRMNIFKKKKQFDGETFINKNGVQMIKNIAKSFQPNDKEPSMTMADLVDRALDSLAVDGDDSTTKRRVSDTLVSRKASELQRKATVKALARRHTEAKRRATIKRVNQRHPQDTIDEAEEDNYPRHHPIVRTNTFKDPEGLEEREI